MNGVRWLSILALMFAFASLLIAALGAGTAAVVAFVGIAIVLVLLDRLDK